MIKTSTHYLTSPLQFQNNFEFKKFRNLIDLNIWYNITNMRAKLVYHVKEYHIDGSVQEIKIWEVPKSKNRPHGLKYSFANISGAERVIGYDNAEGKGDHRHYKGLEYPYKFQSLEKLWKDFKRDIKNSRRTNHES